MAVRKGTYSHLLHPRSWYGLDSTIAGWLRTDFVPADAVVPPAPDPVVARMRGGRQSSGRMRTS